MRFSLRTLLLYFFAACVTTASLTTAWRAGAFSEVSKEIELFIFGVVFRVALSSIAGLLFGFRNGRIRLAIAFSLFGILLGDVAWAVLLVALGTNLSVESFVYNPIILVTAWCCPIATIRQRNVAMIVSCLLAILLPGVVAYWRIASIPTGPHVGGGGLAGVMTIIVAALAAATGLSASLLTLLAMAIMRRNQSDTE